jgi:hypothetical protein
MFFMEQKVRPDCVAPSSFPGSAEYHRQHPDQHLPLRLNHYPSLQNIFGVQPAEARA